MGPYNSYGNGSAMRVSPVGWAYDTEAEVLREAERSAACTHNHPEGIRGAQSTALAVYLARTGRSRHEIRSAIEDRFGYDLSRPLDHIRGTYGLDVTCQGSVPEALVSFYESTDYESAVRNAVSLGGDSDTLACISGAVAQAFYGRLPRELVSHVRSRLDRGLLEIVDRFWKRYGIRCGRIPSGSKP